MGLETRSDTACINGPFFSPIVQPSSTLVFLKTKMPYFPWWMRQTNYPKIKRKKKTLKNYKVQNDNIKITTSDLKILTEIEKATKA